MQMTCVHVDDMCMSLGVVLHEIGQLRQLFAWVLTINLTITTEGLVNQTRGSHLENIKTKRAQQLCIKPTGLLVSSLNVKIILVKSCKVS